MTLDLFPPFCWPVWGEIFTDIVRFISPQYDRGCFQRRNEWMVDHAGRVIAVFNGEKGGTKNTIDYAERQNVPVIYIP